MSCRSFIQHYLAISFEILCDIFPISPTSYHLNNPMSLPLFCDLLAYGLDAGQQGEHGSGSLGGTWGGILGGNGSGILGGNWSGSLGGTGGAILGGNESGIQGGNGGGILGGNGSGSLGGNGGEILGGNGSGILGGNGSGSLGGTGGGILGGNGSGRCLGGRRGQEVGFPRWQEVGEKGKLTQSCTIFCNQKSAKRWEPTEGYMEGPPPPSTRNGSPLFNSPVSSSSRLPKHIFARSVSV